MPATPVSSRPASPTGTSSSIVDKDISSGGSQLAPTENLSRRNSPASSTPPRSRKPDNPAHLLAIDSAQARSLVRGEHRKELRDLMGRPSLKDFINSLTRRGFFADAWAVKADRFIAEVKKDARAVNVAGEDAVRIRSKACAEDLMATQDDSGATILRKAPQSAIREGATRSEIEKLFKQAHEGKPGAGCVWFLGQEHMAPDHDHKAQPRDRDVEYSQKTIFDVLSVMRVKNVFIEGVMEDTDADPTKASATPYSNPASIKLAKKYFGDYKPGQPASVLQRKILAGVGGAAVYCLLHRDVTAHATTTRALDNKACAVLERGRAHLAEKQMSKTERDAVFSEREEEVVRRLSANLHTTDCEVALIYGAKHDFAKYCGSYEFNPTLHSMDAILQRPR